MSQRAKFLLVVIAGLTFLAAIAAIVLDYSQKRVLEEEARDRIEMVLDFAQACQHAAKAELEEAVLEDPQRMIVETMPATVVARDMLGRFDGKLAGYTYKQVVPRSVNPASQADDFEATTVATFAADPGLTEITGHRQTADGEEFYIAQPIVVERKCLMCHGAPDQIPLAITKRFGQNHGTYWRSGEIVGATMVYVPTGHFRSHLAQMRWAVLGIMSTLTLVLIGLTYCVFAKLINRTAELRKARDRLQAVIDGIPSPLMVIDRDYKISLANRVVREYTAGIDPAAHGLTCHRVSHQRDTPCDGSDDPCPLRKAIEDKAAVRVTHVHRNREGKEHVVDITATPIFDETGEVRQVIESCYDVTKHVEALEALRLQSSAVESAANAIMIADRDGRITWINPAFTRLTGFSLKEAVGRNPRILKSGRQSEEFYGKL